MHRSIYLLILLFILITHYAQDWAKIKFTSNSNHQLFFFCLDQVVHIIFLAVVFWTDLNSTGPLNNPNNSLFLHIYNNNIIILYFITALTASYAGHYIIILFKKEFLNNEKPYSFFEKWYGFMERILVVSVFFLGNIWILLAPVIFILRPILYNAMMNTRNISDQFSTKTEIQLSGIFSITLGLLLYLFNM